MTQTALVRLSKMFAPQIIYYPARRHRRVVSDMQQRGTDRYVGYRALWMKVMIRAAFDWVTYRDSPKFELRKDAERAFRWLFEPSDLFNSFENVCHLIDCPPEKFRRWAANLTKDHVAKMEHLERESSCVVLSLGVDKHVSGLDEDGEDA